MKNILVFGLVLSFVIACKTKSIPSNLSNKDRAALMAQKYVIVDGHVDLPYRLRVKNFRLEKDYLGIPVDSDQGDFDYKRAKEGGLDAPFMSIFIPASKDSIESQLLADTLIQMVQWIAKESNEYFEVAYTPSDVTRIKNSGRIALPMGMENGSPLIRLDLVDKYRKAGISYVTLTHSKDNHICDSSYDTTGTWQGLSPYGYEIVPKLAEAGIMIDISHVSDNTFFDVLDITPLPLLASHSSVRKYTPGFERNASDKIIKSMGLNGGVIMVNFGSTFVDGEVSKYRKTMKAAADEVISKRGLDKESEEGKRVLDSVMVDHPLAFADVRRVADHIDHIVKLAGIDHVGFGSDYDGVGDSLPRGLKDVSNYPNLIAELLDRGYSDRDIEKICYKNVYRVWQATLDYSAAHKSK